MSKVTLLRDYPRSASALAFGTATATVIHFAWIPSARTSGVTPLLSIGAGLAYAVAGAVYANRLVDPVRTRTAADAWLVGARISLLALLLFIPPFSFWIYVGTATRGGGAVLHYITFTLLVGLFSFLAAGWALVVVSIGIAWALYRLAGGPAA